MRGRGGALGRGVEIKRGGKDMLGRCPFHEDDTASLDKTETAKACHAVQAARVALHRIAAAY